MTEPADGFSGGTDKLEEIRGVEDGDCLHEYSGVLAETGEPVRIHTLAPALTDSDDAVTAFTRVSDRWANAAANANIVSVRDRGDTPRPWLAVPEEKGASLQAAQSDLSPDAVGAVVGEVADALRTLGLYNTVHGDLSPADIYVSTAGEEPSVRVGAFGLEAAVRAAVGEHEPGPYTAPELRGEPWQPTQRTDVYGLGAVTYFALTGRPPDGDADSGTPPSPPSEHTDVASPLDDVVLQALAERPGDRQESPYAFSRAFLGSFDPESYGTDREEGTTGSGGAETDDTNAEPDGQDSSDDTESETTASDDGDSGLTRRAAVGLLGAGGIGGGALLVTRTPGSGSPDTQPTTEGAPPNAPGRATATRERDTAVADAGTERTTAEPTPTETPEPTPTETPEPTPTETPDSGVTEASAEFAQSVYSLERGSTITITVELAATSVARLQIGTIEDVNYAIVAELEDDDRDGVAAVEFDSYLAANGNPDDTLRAASDTVVSNVDTADGSFEGNQPAGSDLLDDANYRMSVASGPKTGPTVDDPEDIATLSLYEG